MYGVFAVMFAGLWSGRRKERNLLLWSVCNLFGAAGSLAFLLVPQPPLPVLAASFTCFSGTILFAGAGIRLIDGRRPFPPHMVLMPPVVAAACALPFLLAPAALAPLLSLALTTTALGTHSVMLGLYVLRNGRPSFSRRAGGVALLAYVPAYLTWIILDITGHAPGLQFLLVADQMMNYVLVMAFFTMAEEHARRVLSEQALCDELTGSLNRAGLYLKAGERAAGRPRAVLMADLDRFKAINDRHGHAAGDAVIRAFAERVRGALDAGDLVARFGGEEFVILLADPDPDRAMERAEAIRRSLAATPVRWNEAAIAATVSFGVAVEEEGEDLARAIERADRALYAAKAGGRNRVAA